MGIGYVYILVNTSMPGLVKIGKTDRTLDERLTELYTTGVPTPFEVAFKLLSNECKTLEEETHNCLAEFRVNPLREFFRCNVDTAIKVLDKLHARHQAPGESFFQTLERQLRNPLTRNVAVPKLFSHLTDHQDSLDEMLPLLVYVLESQDWHDKDYAKVEAIEWLKRTHDPVAIQALHKYEQCDP